MARCITIINYKLKDQPTFTVEHLSDRAFSNGFRVLNPEFKADSNKIKANTEALNELLKKLDHHDPLAFDSVKHDYMSPRQREERHNPGGDRSTAPVVY